MLRGMVQDFENSNLKILKKPSYNKQDTEKKTIDNKSIIKYFKCCNFGNYANKCFERNIYYRAFTHLTPIFTR